MFSIVKNKKPHLCCAYGCKNDRAERDRFCAKHRHRFRKENDPLKYAYRILQSNAKRRGKEFNLTFQEFQTFCLVSGYLEGKGKCALSYSIDRIDPAVGYEIDNLQVLTLSENTKKMHADNRRDPNYCPF
jgi:hypothetical protein